MATCPEQSAGLTAGHAAGILLRAALPATQVHGVARALVSELDGAVIASLELSAREDSVRRDLIVSITPEDDRWDVEVAVADENGHTLAKIGEASIGAAWVVDVVSGLTRAGIARFEELTASVRP